MATTRRPPALKHGLTSRAAREEWTDDVLQLAEALLGAAPPEPQVLAAAREAAVAILYLRRVQQCRLLVLEDGTLRRAAPTDAERIPALKLSAAVKRAGKVECEVLREELRVVHDAEWVVDIETAATFILGEELGNHAQELRRLSDYERRALSARRKALRRLDLERVEAERRRVAGRHGEARPGVA
jgi:hypothetical protein